MTAKKKADKPAGMYPQADPTAPGGMSQADLRVELAERHGVSMDETRGVKWPVLIDMVAKARLAREDEQRCDLHEVINCAECNGEAAAFDESLTEAAEMFDQPGATASTDDADDLDALLAEFADDDLSTLDKPSPDEVHTYADEQVGAQQEGPVTGQFSPVEDFGTDDDDDDDTVFDPETLFAEIAAAQEAEAAEHPPLFLGIPGIRDYVFDGHAGAGPSASERWMNCTMSLSASRAFLETLSPRQQAQYAGANTAARQGTTAHAAAEAEANVMLGNLTQEEADYLLMELAVLPEDEGEAYDEEMAEYITEYVDLVQSYAHERGTDHVVVEARVEAAIPLAGLHEGEVYIIRGSADMIAMPTAEDPTLVVGDLKYGKGIWVDVDENSQARIYALGALDLLTDDEGNLITDVETVTLHIVQPRMDGIKTWSESVEDLLDWRDDVLSPALTKALYGANEGAEYAPSETACQFCPARGSCPALTEQRLEQAADLFDVIVESEFEDGPGAFPETTSLTDTRLAELLEQISGLIDIHKDLRAEAERRLYRGDTIPGYQLVNYTPARKWKDGALDQIKDAGLPLFKDPTLVTPTQAEKILGKDTYPQIEPLVDKPPIRPVIAKEGDRRKTWGGPPPEQMFPDMEEGA